MTIEQEIAQWAGGRPLWQQFVLQRAASGAPLTTDELRALAEDVLSGAKIHTEPLDPAGIPTAGPAAARVSVLEIRDLKSVNALVGGQTLSFGDEGLTLVYGDNASGKSGYARLIKSMVAARHHEAILANVFAAAPLQQEATVRYKADAQEHTVSWQGGGASLPGITFYDEHCGNAYVTTESEVTFRPAPLSLLDQLIRACDDMRAHIDAQLYQLAPGALPAVEPGTTSATFLSNLTGATSTDEIERACELPVDWEARLQGLHQELTRLRSTDVSAEKGRLTRLSRLYERQAGVLSSVEDGIAVAQLENIRALREDRDAARDANTMASQHRFANQPLNGVGTNEWRHLWEAARRYALTVDSQSGPEGVRGRCVLCQQVLDEEATQRLTAFETFVREDTAARVAQLEAELNAATSTLHGLQRQLEQADTISEQLAEEDSEDGPRRRQEVLALKATYQSIRSAVEVGAPVTGLRSDQRAAPAYAEAARRLRESADQLDVNAFTEQVAAHERAASDLQAQSCLASSVAAIIKERDRRALRAKLEDLRAATDTRGISRKAADLVRDHVTQFVRDQFTREADRLRLERVTLVDTGGKKGSLQHVPALLGAARPAELPRVLSEGEQTALGLAGFFTEAFFDSSMSALVLDDPVTSLDHIRRGRVAERLAEIAAARQVIVFTHDVSFVADIRSACEQCGVRVTERCVERRVAGDPGVCKESHPWKAKDASQRLDSLSHELAGIGKNKDGWGQDEYERATSDWAGKLSETWERIVSLEVVGQVVERGTLEVRPKMVKLLARITADDEADFQSGYSVVSRWARRHDKSLDINYVPPAVDEMKAELERATAWLKRVKTYRN